MSMSGFLSSMTIPALMLDAFGLLTQVSNPANLAAAMRASGETRRLTGTDRCRWFEGAEESQGMDPAIEDLLIFWNPGDAGAESEDVTRAARTIARCNLPSLSGNRAVGWLPVPPSARRDAAVPFLVSRTIWYNDNRRTIGFPACESSMADMMKDINLRLGEGSVSVERA